jgi:PAS fold
MLHHCAARFDIAEEQRGSADHPAKFFSKTHSSDAERSAQAFADCVAGLHGGSYSNTYRVQRRDGSLRTLKSHAETVTNEDGTRR